MLGVPLGELALLAAAILVGGVIAGLLAGLFGVGGGVIAVPVLYEVFRILGVPDAVHMQLCIGTSLAIMAPTNIRSYLTHRATGAVLTDVVRQWTPGVIVGIAIGSLIATVAPSPVFKIAFIVMAGIIAGKLLFAQERWRLGDDLPTHPLARLYGLAVGLMASLTGVSGGSLCTMVLTLYGKPIHQAVATSAGIVVPITLAGTRRLRARRPAASGGTAAAVDRLRVADRLRVDGAGVVVRRALRREVCAHPVEAGARDRVRAVPVGRGAAVSGEPGLVTSTCATSAADVPIPADRR